AELVLCLRELGAEPLLHVSHRGREGYGLNPGALGRLRAAGARVVVTADCGTADEGALAHAADLGLDVIVCDHHHAPTRRPPGLVALKQTALVDGVSVRAIGFRLAPRLNAGGRLADARVAVELLTTESVERAGVLAAELEMHNAERRALEDAMVAEAVSAIEARRDPHARTIVVAREGWHPGVVGIVAARLAERFHRPALAIALEGATARGSGRSVRGVHLHAALGECRALLEAFGGHRQAVGFTVRRERVGELAARVEEAVSG